MGEIDDEDIQDISGGWSYTFETFVSATVTIEFDYEFEFGSRYERDEFGELLMSFDGTELPYLARFNGDGESGPAMIQSELDHVETFSEVEPGTHIATFGCYNNEKTADKEYTQCRFDNIKITVIPDEASTPTNSPTSNPTNSPSSKPTDAPTASPSSNPTNTPTISPSSNPSNTPTSKPTEAPVSPLLTIAI